MGKTEATATAKSAFVQLEGTMVIFCNNHTLFRDSDPP
jgi:hypothetical protein